MSELKFVSFRGYQEDCIIVFPKKIQHLLFAEAITRLSYGELTPISGGFVENGECVGKSISLRMGSSADDTKLLNDMLKSD